MSRHPLCTGAGCTSCARLAADRKRVVDELRDRLDRAEPDAFGQALRWLVDSHPDLVAEALTEAGVPE